MKLLIGEISSYKAIVIAKYIKRNYKDVIIYSYDFTNKFNYIHTKYSDFHFNVTYHPDTYIFELTEIINKENIDYFFPVNSYIINKIIENKSLFGNSLSYLGENEDYQILNNKSKLYELAKTLNIRVPKLFKTYLEAEIPFVIKPEVSSSAKGVIYIKNQNDYKKFSNKDFSKKVIQEYINGIGCGYSVYCRKGEILVGCGHKRLIEFPVTGGSSLYRDFFFVDDMYKISSQILKKIKWTGFAMFEFKYTKDGELILIEVNPRIWGSINQGLQNGINYFANILGEINSVKKNKGEKIIKTYLSPLVYFALFHHILMGNFRPFFNFVSNIKNNKADISLLDDIGGWVNLILRKLR